jgi:hypothetical protein
MFPAPLGKYFIGHRQSVRLEWCPCRSSFVVRFCCFAGGTVVVVAASVAVAVLFSV